MGRKKIQYKNYHIVSNISNETPHEDSPVDEEVDGVVIEHRWHDKEMAKAWLIWWSDSLKVARTKSGDSNDNWIDIAGYAACAAELID